MVSFEAGPSIFNAAATSDLLQTSDRVRFSYAAAVAHQIGQSWLLAGSFNHGSQFNQGYGGPVFADEVYASVTGFFSARTDITASVAYTEGQSVLTLAGRKFVTSAAGASLRHALSRNWALTAQYFSLFVRLHQRSRPSDPDRACRNNSRATACAAEYRCSCRSVRR